VIPEAVPHHFLVALLENVQGKFGAREKNHPERKKGQCVLRHQYYY